MQPAPPWRQCPLCRSSNRCFPVASRPFQTCPARFPTSPFATTSSKVSLHSLAIAERPWQPPGIRPGKCGRMNCGMGTSGQIPDLLDGKDNKFLATRPDETVQSFAMGVGMEIVSAADGSLQVRGKKGLVWLRCAKRYLLRLRKKRWKRSWPRSIYPCWRKFAVIAPGDVLESNDALASWHGKAFAFQTILGSPFGLLGVQNINAPV